MPVGLRPSRRLRGLQHIAQTRRHYLLASLAQRQDPSAERLHCQVTATGRFKKIPVAPSCIYQIAGLRCIYGRFDTEFFPSMVPVASLGWFTTSGRGTAQPCLFSFIVLFDFSVTAISDF